MQSKLARLVPSCDKYADLWGPFFKLFWKFWADCPYPVYLLSNQLVVGDNRIQTLHVGRDISWSDNLAKALGRINYDYVFLFLDDLFLADYVDTGQVVRVLDWAMQSKVKYIRLSSCQKPDCPCNDIAGIVSPGMIYRTSTVVSAWEKRMLLTLLRPGESAWDFEIKGTVRSDEFDGFYSTWVNCFPVINSVIKGKWLPFAVKKIESLGANVDLSRRPMMTKTEEAMFLWKRCRSGLLNIVPARHRRSVRTFFISSR
jgi:hypothetical protein